MKRETHEVAWRAKLVFGLALLGALVGVLLYLHFLIFDSEPQEIGRYALAAYNAFTLDLPGARHARRELLMSGAAGAAALAGPLLLFLLKPRGGYRP